MESIEKLIKNKNRLWSDVIHLSENLLFFKFYIAVYEKLYEFQEKECKEKFLKEKIVGGIYFSSTSTYFFRLTKDNFYNASLVCIRRLTDEKSKYNDNISLKIFVNDVKEYAKQNKIFDTYKTTFEEYERLEVEIDKVNDFIDQNIAHIDNNQKDHSDCLKELLPNIEKITKGLQELFQAFMGILENTSYSGKYNDLNFPSFLFHYKLYNPYEITPEAKSIYKEEILKSSEEDRLKFNSKKLEIENFIKEIEANYIKKWNELKKEIYLTKYVG